MTTKDKQNNFGGPWTKQKLAALKSYLDSYTTALKNQRFELWYIDGFAGTGEGQGRNNYSEATEYIKGSPLIAMEIQDRSFDKFLFIEKDEKAFNSLKESVTQHALYSRERVSFKNKDANEAIPEFCKRMQQNDRAVMFLDPFATSVDFETIRIVANTEKIDLWYLFPWMAVNRLLPKDSSEKDRFESTLNRVFGDQSWNKVYEQKREFIW